ncbi:MAG: hypothetical protein WCC12_12065 [Anaerolineales bacterium]
MGTGLRFVPGFLTRFPVNDGSMFLSMIRDLRANFFLPAFTSYYAFLPGSAAWLIMGCGLRRAFGILFSLLVFGYVYRLFRAGMRPFP